MKKKERYYLHGDQIEHDCDKYYCRSCDFDFPRSHFAEHDYPPGASCANNQKKYQQSLKSWRFYKKNYSHQYHRPDNAINLFE